MKKRFTILFILLLCASTALADSDGYWTTNEDSYYHVDPTCGGAEDMLPISMAGAAEFEKFPCPLCRPEALNVCGPAWCADPATYNSQMDAYKDGHAVRIGDSIYYTELYGWDAMGEILMRMDANGDASTAEIVAYLPEEVRIAGIHGSFAYEDDILYLDYKTGDVHKFETDSNADSVLFTTKDAFPPFLLLVGDRFYSAEDETVGYYSIPDGSFTPLCELDLDEAWDWNVVYAEGKLIVMVYAERGAFVCIDTATGEVIDLSAPLASALSRPYPFLAIHGRIYATSAEGGLISANYDGSDVQSLPAIHDDSIYSIRRAYDRYVFVTDQIYEPSERIFIAQGIDALRFEPANMQCTLLPYTSMYFLCDRVYIQGDSSIDLNDTRIFLYDSYDLKEYLAEALENPLEEHVNTGW